MLSLCRASALVAGILLMPLTSCSKKPAGKNLHSGAEGSPRLVQVALSSHRPMERVIAVSGTFGAQEQATISVKVSGRVKTVAVDIGSVLELGALIAQVEPRDYELRVQQAAAALAQARAMVGLPLEGTDDRVEPEKTSVVRQAKAVLDEATKNHERVKSLHEQGVVPKSELDTAEATYTVAVNRREVAFEDVRTRQAVLAQRRAEYELAKQQLSDTTVRAPFAGVLQARLIGLGEFLAAGAPVAELVQSDPLRLRLEIPEREAAVVRHGQAVRLTVEGNTNVYRGVLARISPALDLQTRVLVVEADVLSQGVLRPGLFASAEIVVLADDPGLAVPTDALVVFAGLEKVIVVQGGKAAERGVTTGRRGHDWVEIVDGLEEGESVVLNPGNLRSGQAVVTSSPGSSGSSSSDSGGTVSRTP